MAPELDIFQDILSDVRLCSTIDTLPFWRTELQGMQVDGNATDYLLSANSVAFRLSTYSDLAYLCCYARVPDYLELEKGRAGIEDMQHFMLVDFPRLFYQLDGFVDEQKLYKENSFLSFTSRDNEEDTFTFQIKSEADRANLLQTYSQLNRRNTKMASIVAARGYELDRKQSRLSIVYAEEDGQPDELRLCLPMNEFGISGWTSRAVSWVLRNHASAENIDNLDLAANELSGDIRKIATGVLYAQRHLQP